MTVAETIKNKLSPRSTEAVRAVIYARVSTDNEGQKESCSNQVTLAKNYISDHPNISLVATYVDDGISGKNDFTRPQYNEMLQQLSEEKFDLIITKALSRLNRDELNSLMLNSLLIEHNATVLTLEDNQIHDFEDMNSGLLHSIKYAMDAQFVKQQSINGRKTQELRCEKKELSAKDCSYGYDWDRESKAITINNDQAEIIRRIFEDYVYRNGTPSSIHKALMLEGITLSSHTISNIIMDERYIGKFYINKRTTKLGTGRVKSKRIKLPREQWVLCERPNLQIVDTDLFEMAQRIHQTRITIYEKPDKKSIQARFQGTHKYAGKIFCPICGKPYQFAYADRNKQIPIYKTRNHSDCISPVKRISEYELDEITKKALKQIIDQQEEVCISLEQTLTEIVIASQNNNVEIDKLKKLRETKEKQIDNLIEQLSMGGLNEAVQSRMRGKITHITDESVRLTESIKNMEGNKLDDSYVTDKIASIKAAISDLRNFTSINRDRILNFIERIDLRPDGDIEILLKSGKVIIAKQHNDSDLSNEKSVGKKVRQDAPC